MSETLLKDRNVIYSYDLKETASPDIDLSGLGMGHFTPDGTKTVVLMASEKCRVDDDSPVGVVLNFARNSLYYMAMWKMDVHIGLIDDQENVERYLIDNKMVKEFEKFLGDVGMVDLKLDVKDGRIVLVKGSGTLPFTESVSRGTMILCRLFCWINRCRNRDALMFFDDFDDMFHYRTAENAIKSIIAGTKAQCIFVTHNTGLVSNDFLRPDCCFIMDNGKLNSIASLSDKDIRRGHNLEKMLREGEFDRRSVEQ